MESRALKIGDQLQITTDSFSGTGEITNICKIESDTRVGLLIDCDIEDYGDAVPFYLPGGVLPMQANDRRGRSGMPKEYAYKFAKDFIWSQYSEDVTAQKKITNAFVKRFKDFQGQGRGLYIYSRTKGSGKTLLACCIVNELLKERDIPVKFISISDYIELIKDKSESAKDDRDSILNAALLVVDDIGMQSESKDWISDCIFRLVDTRHRRLLPTIYTSNLQVDELKCDERAKERIYEDSIQLVMPEVNVRRKKADRMNKEFLNDVLAG